MDTYMKVAKFCVERGITLSDVANGVGIRRSVFTELKMGRTKQLSIPTLEKIAAFFDVPVAYFLEDTDDVEMDSITKKRRLIYALTQRASEEDLDALLTLIQNLTRQGKSNDTK